MEKLRKILVISVMMITVLSMCVIVAPQAGAAASAGSLIKMNGLSSVYYLAGDGKRYVFPNESTYFSWYGDFSGVVTIPQSELESYPLGANVTVRPGTKLVKITTNPNVFAVAPNGQLVLVPSETVASTLWGANWAKRVIDISDAFFTNYKSSVASVSATAYPTGSLVKLSTGADVFYIAADGKAQKITSEAAFLSNRFSWDNVITAAATYVLPSAGADITGTLAAITDTSSGAGGSIGAGTGVTVALASDTPPSATTLVSDTDADGAQALIPVLKANLTASNDGDVKITTLKFKRGGVPSADADFAEFYLYDGANLLAKYSSISSGVLNFNNASGLFTITKGTTKAVTLKVNLAIATAASRNYNFSVNAASDITTDGASVSGSFPVVGNTMTVSSINDLGKLTIATAGNSAAPDPGTANHTLWKMTAATVNQDISIERLKFTVIGTIDPVDLANFKIDVAGTQLGATVATMASDKTITFDLATPYVITKGNTKTINLKGDVVSGTNKTYQFYIYNKEDLVAKDLNYNVYITPNQADSWTKINAAAATTINAGALTVSKNTNSPSGNVAKGATNMEIARFDFKSTGEAIKIDTVNLYVVNSQGWGGLKQVKLFVDGGQVGTAKDMTLEATVYPISMGNSFIIPAGQTKTLVVNADIKTATGTAFATDETISFQLGNVSSVSYTKQSSGGTGTAGAQSANVLTVRTGTVGLAKNSSFGNRTASNPTGTVNATGVKIASLVITAGSGEAVDVSQITLKDGLFPLANNFQNLKVMNGTTQIGTTISTLNSATSTYDFTPSSAIRILSGAQYVVDVYADIKSTVTNSAVSINPVISADGVTATGVSTSQDASVSSQATALQAAYITTAGTLNVSTDADTTLSHYVVMGATDQEIAKFKFAAGASEAINISEIIISDNTSAVGTLNNISLYDGTTKIAGPVQFGATAATSTYYNARFPIALVIPANTSKVYTVKADVSTFDSGATGGTAHTFAILINNGISGTESVTARGASSGTTIDGTSLSYAVSGSTDVDQSGNGMIPYRTLISAAYAADTPSGSGSGGAGQIVAKINFTNSANAGNYSATLQGLNFNISNSCGNTDATRALTIYKDSIATVALATSNYPSGSPIGNSAIVNTDMTDVSIAAGATKLIIATLDTTNCGSTKNLSISVGSTGVYWADGTPGDTGVSALINAIPGVLPLASKTITY